MLAVLVDPDKFNQKVIDLSNYAKVDFFFVGGSQVNQADFRKTIAYIKKNSKIPTILFPGDENQISAKADALLLLSLVSGRNPEYLIGKHVNAASKLKKSKLEIIPTAYLMIDGGINSSTSKVTHTTSILQHDRKTIVDTAVASELMGMNLIYLEAGSGAKNIISGNIIKMVRRQTSVPILCGGGIDSIKKLENCWKNGADLAVVGNALEKKPELILELIKSKRKINKSI